MARRSFDVVDVTEILIHWHARREPHSMKIAGKPPSRCQPDGPIASRCTSAKPSRSPDAIN